MDVIIIVLVIIVVFLTIMVLLSGSSVVRSGKFTVNDSKANMYYYLPKGLIKVTSVAEVMIYTDKDYDKLKGMYLLSQSFVHEIEIIPDSRQILKLSYVNNIFSKDEIDLKINDKGLLTNVNIVTEDRLPNIIEALTKAPITVSAFKQIDSEKFEEKLDINYVVTVEKFTRTFLFDPDDLTKKENWIISKIDQYKGSMHVDAGFAINRHLPELEEKPASLGLGKAVDGIVSRPMILQKFVITPTSNELNAQTVEFYESLPDTNLNFNIPVSRALFSKISNNLLISNGMLVGYKMEKPSELEGFISIPINIAKAIISIPAQLFQFRIDTTKRKTVLETEVLKRNKVISDQTIPELQKELDTLKKEIEKLKGKKS